MILPFSIVIGFIVACRMLMELKGPCKPATSADFVEIFLVSQNPLKVAMPIISV